MADAVAGLERALAIGMSVSETVDMASPWEASSAALAACRSGDVSLSEAELRHQSFRSACEPDGLEAWDRTESQSKSFHGKFMVASNSDGSRCCAATAVSSRCNTQSVSSVHCHCWCVFVAAEACWVHTSQTLLLWQQRVVQLHGNKWRNQHVTYAGTSVPVS